MTPVPADQETAQDPVLDAGTERPVPAEPADVDRTKRDDEYEQL